MNNLYKTLNNYIIFNKNEESHKILIIKFIQKFIDDFNINKYKHEDIFNLLFVNSKLNNIYIICYKLLKILLYKIPNNLEYLLQNYNINLNLDKIININNFENKQNFCLAQYFYNKFTDSICIKTIIKYLPKNKDNKSLLNNIIDYDIIDYDINLINFSLFIDNNIFIIDTFNIQILSLLYYREDIHRLNIIFEINPDLLTLSINQLTKIIFYGRYKTLLFLIKNLNLEFLLLINNKNVYNLDNININFINDIWNGHSWHNDECERDNIQIPDFNNTFKLINSYILTQHNKFNKKQIVQWINRIINFDSDSDYKYYINIDILLSLININLNNKENIKKLINIIGYEKCWNILINRDSSILKILTL
jgi:hypothetical protein